MAFQVKVNEKIKIGAYNWSVVEHPNAPGVPYGQEGRAGVVYQLINAKRERQALKVFRSRFRSPTLVSLCDQLGAFADLPGLKVCRRTVVTPDRHGELLQHYPDLTFAVLMPWIEGTTWFEIIEERRELSLDQSAGLARALGEVLALMEEHGLAHCDLSGPNVLLPVSSSDKAVSVVELVDVEQMFGPGLSRPLAIPIGSAGYAHQEVKDGIWSSSADRFAGAILLAEMLGWCDERVRNAAWGESYFSPTDMHKDISRYHVLVQVLEERWGKECAQIFKNAWHSKSLNNCPTFREWLTAIPQYALSKKKISISKPIPSDALLPLFEKAINAYNHEEWLKAKEFFLEIVKQNQNYERNGYRVQTLLNDIESRLKKPLPFGVAFVVGIITIILGIAIFNPLMSGGASGGEVETSSQPSAVRVVESVPTRTPKQINTPIPTKTLKPINTSVPTKKPTLTRNLTPTLDSSPRLYFDQDLFCRTGPASSYPDVTAFTAGTVFPILATNNQGWWLVQIPPDISKFKSCWVGGGIPQGNYSSVPIIP